MNPNGQTYLVIVLHRLCLYCFGISITQQLTTWADTSHHLFPLKCSMGKDMGYRWYFLNMGRCRLLFVYFRSFQTALQFEKSIDFVGLGVRTQGCRIAGADRSTELWRPIFYLTVWCCYCLKTFWVKLNLQIRDNFIDFHQHLTEANLANDVICLFKFAWK